MTDNKKIRSKQDRIRIDKNDPSEVEYLQQKFPDCSHEQILEAIRKAGPYREAVIRYLHVRNGKQ